MNRVGDLNLWALGYDDPTRAREVRTRIRQFESEYGLHVNDAIIVSRYPNGSFTIDRENESSSASGVAGFGALGFLAGLVVLEPLVGAAVGAALGGLVATAARQVGIDVDFINEAKDLMKPGTSALFLLTRTDNPEAVAHHITGLGGTVLKSNVNPELARLVQDSLDATRPSD